jgi:hypothetical protein
MEPKFFFRMLRLLRNLGVGDGYVFTDNIIRAWERYEGSKKYEFTSAEKTKKEAETFEAGAR